MSGRATPPATAVLWLAAGFGVWLVALGAVYGLHGVGCALGLGDAVIRLSLAAAVTVALAIIALLDRWLRASGWNGALLQLGRWTLWAAFVATVASLVPSLLLTPCR